MLKKNKLIAKNPFKIIDKLPVKKTESARPPKHIKKIYEESKLLADAKSN